MEALERAWGDVEACAGGGLVEPVLGEELVACEGGAQAEAVDERGEIAQEDVAWEERVIGEGGAGGGDLE